MPDGKLGYKSREQLKAVSRRQGRDGGHVRRRDRRRGAASSASRRCRSSRRTIADARALYEAARPSYEAAFERHNQKLLYATPWPPSGLWTKAAGRYACEAIAKLKVRTYDKTGTDVFTHLGAKARRGLVQPTWRPKLASGEIDAVLSSGDGGAGRKLWEHLPRFTEINYAIPLSFTTVNLDRWNSLDDATRARRPRRPRRRPRRGSGRRSRRASSRTTSACARRA